MTALISSQRERLLPLCFFSKKRDKLSRWLVQFAIVLKDHTDAVIDTLIRKGPDNNIGIHRLNCRKIYCDEDAFAAFDQSKKLLHVSGSKALVGRKTSRPQKWYSFVLFLFVGIKKGRK